MVKKQIEFNTYDHNFGFVLPMHTGVYWEQQTNGVCCNHVSIEGVFIPLPMQSEILGRLTQANYKYDEKAVCQCWVDLHKALKVHEGLEFEEVEPPIHNPENQEGLVWVKIIRWDSCIGHGEGMVGMTVALIYPNCD
jgi:hypothetical protein